MSSLDATTAKGSRCGQLMQLAVSPQNMYSVANFTSHKKASAVSGGRLVLSVGKRVRNSSNRLNWGALDMFLWRFPIIKCVLLDIPILLQTVTSQQIGWYQ